MYTTHYIIYGQYPMFPLDIALQLLSDIKVQYIEDGLYEYHEVLADIHWYL